MGRGPVPEKPATGTRKRAEHPQAVVFQLVQGGGQSAPAEPPKVPPMPPAPWFSKDGEPVDWHQRARDVWRAFWLGPKPPEFVAEVHTWLVEKLITLEQVYALDPTGRTGMAASAEARMLYQHLMVTPAELRRAKIEVKRPEEQPKAATGTTGSRRRDPRARR